MDKARELRLTIPCIAQRYNGELQYYEVVSTTNSVEYTPGDRVHRNEIAKLCDDSMWEVIIE